MGGNVKSQQSAIRLHELGPRLALQLVKIEEGLCDGKVVHHSFIEKTSEEARKDKQKLKDQRQIEQNTNVVKKKKSLEEHKRKCLEGMGADGEKANAGQNGEEDDDDNNNDDDEYTSDEDDAEYFRKEVGEDPEVGSFSKPGM